MQIFQLTVVYTLTSSVRKAIKSFHFLMYKQLSWSAITLVHVSFHTTVNWPASFSHRPSPHVARVGETHAGTLTGSHTAGFTFPERITENHEVKTETSAKCPTAYLSQSYSVFLTSHPDFKQSQTLPAFNVKTENNRVIVKFQSLIQERLYKVRPKNI